MESFNAADAAAIVLAATVIAKTGLTQVWEYNEILATGNDTTQALFDSDKIKENLIVVLTNVCAGSSDVSSTRVDMGIWNGVTFKPFYVASQATDNILISWQGQIILKEGDQLRVRINGTTASTDTLQVLANGYSMKE